MYTNKPFGGAYRGFGLPELMGAMEVVIDIAPGRSAWTRSSSAEEHAEAGASHLHRMPMNAHALDTIVNKIVAKIKLKEKEPATRKGGCAQGFALALKAPAMPSMRRPPPSSRSSATARSTSLRPPWTGAGRLYGVRADGLGRAGHPYREISATIRTRRAPVRWQTVASRSCWSMAWR